MSEEPFKNREIIEMFNDVKQKLDDIVIQTTKHNGRMTTVERNQAYAAGGISVLTLIVIPMLAWAMWTLANISDIVHNSVDQAVSAYHIK
jgi:hypothetical protein